MILVWMVVFGTATTIIGTALVLRARFVAVRVEGASMEPVLRAGDRVLVRRVRLERVRAGQVVVFAPPTSELAVAGNPPWRIKRAVALPGDPVPHARVPGLPQSDRQVPAGWFVALGDNAAHSHDSRTLGYIEAEALLGVVVRVMRATPSAAGSSSTRPIEREPPAPSG
jgi:signal peptidase I